MLKCSGHVLFFTWYQVYTIYEVLGTGHWAPTWLLSPPTPRPAAPVVCSTRRLAKPTDTSNARLQKQHASTVVLVCVFRLFTELYSQDIIQQHSWFRLESELLSTRQWYTFVRTCYMWMILITIVTYTYYTNLDHPMKNTLVPGTINTGYQVVYYYKLRTKYVVRAIHGSSCLLLSLVSAAD